MKATWGAGLALALFAGHALAQTPPQPPDAPPPPGANGPMDGRMAPDDPAGGRAGDMRPHRMGHFGPPPSKAARFHIETGDADIGIKCADDEPMKTCTDFTLQLLDKLAAMPRH